MLSELYIPPVVEAAQTLEDLDDALLTLRFDLGKLEAAWERAFAPITARVVPAIDQGVRALTDFVDSAGQVIAALFGGVQLEAKKTVTVTGRSVKRALADFDRLDRLSTGSGSGSSTYTVPAQIKAIPEEMQKIADRIRDICDSIKGLLAPLQAIDLSAAARAFDGLRTAIEPFARGLFAGLEWLWFHILTPMAAWSAEQALPAFLGAVSAALQALNTVAGAARPVFSWLWESLLQPLAQWTGEKFLQAMEAVTGYFRGLKTLMEWLSPLAGVLAGALDGLRSGFERLCAQLGQWNSWLSSAGVGLGLLERAARWLGELLCQAAGHGQTLWQVFRSIAGALTPGVKQTANAVAGIVNTVLAAVESAVNAMVSAINSLRIDIPGWVPMVGGKRLGFNLSTVSLPRIPALAQGAVLPANRPFLAVVGDQKRGTNVEAPLEVIQQAVAQVMGSNAELQQDTNRLLSQLLTAVASIQVGDDTIGRAARRYEHRMAVMGGVL